jgi:hypothetical protein
LKPGAVAWFSQDKRSNALESDFCDESASRAPISPISINKVKLAPPSGTEMFQNRINFFVPNVGISPLNSALLAAASSDRTADRFPTAVQISDIYQEAKNRAIEDHELDKLFNPEFYDYQI